LHHDILFTFQAQGLFKQAAISLNFLSRNVSYSKQAGVVFIPAFTFSAISPLPSFKRLVILFYPFFISLLI